MHRFDLPFASPAHQLAADEALLDWREADGAPDERAALLLFWEPAETFVVAGYANKLAAEVKVSDCEERGIPVFRRCSGGGAVVQMPGGLNYSLILPIIPDGATRNIASANRFIMEKNRDAIQSLCGPEIVISVRGHTDLALAQRSAPGDFRKFAGNSQRRRRHFLLFHGTFLLGCELGIIGELLRMPSLQPDYRAGRPHADFVTNLNLPAAAVKTALAQAWNVTSELADPPLSEIDRLARDKYATREWNYKF